MESLGKTMNQKKLYLSTIDPNAAMVAEKYGLGLEIAEYCTAWNMDEKFPQTHEKVEKTIKKCNKRLLHAPFNELFPCAIDPKARALAAERYRQAVALACRYGAEKVVVHGGFHPLIYYPEWYVEQSVSFWKSFLKEETPVQIVLENVLEKDPCWMLDVVQAVDDPRLGLCLDIGHVNAYSQIPVMQWLEKWAPKLSHFHIHNNDGTWDTHRPLWEGSIPMREFIEKAEKLCPQATFTLELADSESSVSWLLEKQ